VNIRDRYLATMRFEPCPRTPRWELGFWSAAIKRWYDEGLPGTQQAIRAKEGYGTWVTGNGQANIGAQSEDRDRDVMAYFSMDEGAAAIDINYNVCPQYEAVVLEENDHYTIRRGGDGVVRKDLRERYGGSMPEWIDYPVHNRQEWERFKVDRYQPNLQDRVPEDWGAQLEAHRQREYPLCLGSGTTGYFGTVRHFLGLERTLLTFYDDPAWMHEMMDYLADFYVTLYDQVLSQVKVDYAVHWEDMCYVAGPLISPRMFAEFMLGPYKRLTGLLRDHGVGVIMVDTDGDCRKLIPLFLEGGVTALYPFEVQSHMDVSEIRREYPRLGMQGGIDKKALAAGREAIDRELEARVPVVLSGGYIPHVDHGVPPDISWDNFRYYRRKLDAMLDDFDAGRWARDAGKSADA
jgi:uroporphyrinogen decarboxylase